MSTITATMKEKGDRLVRDGKVTRVKGNAYTVVGDSDVYAVWLSFPEEASGRCECKYSRSESGRVCSHLFAASVYALANPEEPTVKDGRDAFRGLGI